MDVKGKGKSGLTGLHLPRTRITTQLVVGKMIEWKGKYGWIQPTSYARISNCKVARSDGRLYVSISDVRENTRVAMGLQYRFHVFEDACGLGAEEVERCVEENKESLRTICVSQILFTHNSILGHFRDGRTLWSLVGDFCSGAIDPLTHPHMILDCWEDGRKIFSMSNRRLWCIRKYQELFPSRHVMAKCKILGSGSHQLIRKFCSSLTSQNGGRSVQVRRPRGRRRPETKGANSTANS